MDRLPTLKSEDVAKMLEKLGFVEIARRGRHKHYRHPDGRRTTLPVHPGCPISPVLLRQIAKI
jgi:predicted RNA binding protein YcfA (HicA-like mRNA interferase family)